MRLAFCLDGYAGQVAAEVRQDGASPGQPGPAHAGAVRCVAYGEAGTDLGRVRAQVARVLSLDHDGREFSRVGERDPVIGRLQAAAPGLRPPLFYSPYEAAVWCVLSARRPARQMMQVRDRLGRAHGAVFELAGEQLAALPTPDQLLAVDAFPGIPADRMPRLHGVARAALDGLLDAGRLLEQGPGQAMAGLQALAGIGPFYSSLIVVRGTGFADVLPVGETRVLDLAARLYGLGAPPSEADFRALAEPWKPLRTWAVVLIRAAAGRVLDGAAGGAAGAAPGVR
jgi:DNA-3-methyladenine glycosylase II